MRRTYCDRCGKEFDIESLFRDAKMIFGIKTYNNLFGFYRTWDLCPDCSNKLYAWLVNNQDKDGD